MPNATKEAHQALESLLTPNPVKDKATLARLDKLRAAGKVLGHAILDVVPEGAEQDRALLAVREAILFAVAGAEAHQPVKDPRVSAARIDEPTAVAMRDAQARQSR